MYDVLKLHVNMYHHLYQLNWHLHFYYIITIYDKKKRSKNKIFIFIFLTFTICKCCRPTAKWRAVCKLIFWLLIEAFPLVKSNSATRQWSLSAAKCKAVKPSSFFSSTSHWRFWIFERISSIALKNKWISFLFIYLFILYIYISWQLLIHITTIVFFSFSVHSLHFRI